MIRIASAGLAGAVLLSLATAALAAAGSAGRRRAGTMAATPGAPNITSEIEIAGDGKVAGTGGCNRLVSQATIKGSALKFGPVAGTMMMCDDAKMAQERAFHDALGATAAFRLESGGKTLVLLDAAGKAVAELARE